MATTPILHTKALELYRLHLAWRLHLCSGDYNAWENNFKTNLNPDNFFMYCRHQGTPQNDAVRMTQWLLNRGVDQPEFLEYMVVSTDRPTTIHSNRGTKLEKYQQWLQRPVPRLFHPEDLVIINGVTGILLDVQQQTLDPLRAAEIIHNSQAWDQVWSTKGDCNFMFDINWPKVHRYRGLFERK